MNAIDLAGRCAVVTGGAQGLGRAIAERLLASGASVSLWDRDRALVEATARELKSIGRTHAVNVDVTKEDDVARATEETTAALGGLDILIANAGISVPTRRSGNIRRTHGAKWSRST